MLQVFEGVEEMPRALPLTDHSREEYRGPDGTVLIRKSKQVWTLLEDGEILLIAGLYEPTFTAVPELWLLLCTGFPKKLRRNALFVRDYFENLLDDHPRIEVKMRSDYLAGQRFATFMGFKEVDRAKMNDGNDYVIYEVRRVI